MLLAQMPAKAIGGSEAFPAGKREPGAIASPWVQFLHPDGAYIFSMTAQDKG